MDYGIDLSHWNTLTDADAVRRAGITYAWCKATEGVGYVDRTLRSKVKALQAAGIVVGAYHFARSGDPRDQADHFRATVAGLGLLDAGALLPMLDMESDDARGGADDFVRIWFDHLRVERAEVYANLDWWRNVLHPETWGTRNLFGHIARYNGDPGNPGYSYDRMAVHQHTQTGRVDGVAGNCDRNATMGRFDLGDLRIGGDAPPPVPQPRPTPANCYRVVPGDTLSGIAARWGATVSAVAVRNDIANPDVIHIGQLICKPDALPPPPANGRYTVRSGDTLSEIAERHNTTVPVLVRLNALSNPDRIFAGQVLKLPGGTSAVSTYIVRSGDTLAGIAARLSYPGGYQALAARNGIRNPDRIFAGQVIRY